MLKTIEIDEELYDYIGKLAKPFVDSPNSVLRRLLLGNGESTRKVERASSWKEVQGEQKDDEIPSGKFVEQLLLNKFGGSFGVRPPFRMMFESERQIVYFQNFNKKGTTNLWFRLNKSPMDVLRKSKKEAFVCLTNPAEKFGFVLPLVEIDKKIKSVDWSRKELEVNIDPVDSRWRELEWNLEKHLYQVG